MDRLWTKTNAFSIYPASIYSISVSHCGTFYMHKLNKYLNVCRSSLFSNMFIVASVLDLSAPGRIHHSSLIFVLVDALYAIIYGDIYYSPTAFQIRSSIILFLESQTSAKSFTIISKKSFPFPPE
jgi:hypothetical protein